MSAKQNWNPELYEARHSFVWQFGQGLIELLKPQRGERILDLGCGPGQLTAHIAELGAEIVGLDASPEMVGQARQNFPDLRFVLADAGAMNFNQEFDAIFSNAALHWMPDTQRIAETMARALKQGGRLVAELGGKGNVAQIEAALEAVLPRFNQGRMPVSKTYFSSVGEYSQVLERAGLEVRFAHLFDRPTPLEGQRAMEEWIRQFSWYLFSPLPADRREEALREVLDRLRATLHCNDSWFVDYRRLRLMAVKL